MSTAQPTPENSSQSPPSDFASWHPKLQRFYLYWKKLHPPGRLPGRQHFDPLDIPDLLAALWLLDVQREPFRLRYRVVGTRIIEAIGREVTGMWLDQAHPHLVNDAAYFDRYRTIVETRTPNRRRGKPKAWAQDEYREVENLAAPLASDGETVDMILMFSVFHYRDGRSE